VSGGFRGRWGLVYQKCTVFNPTGLFHMRLAHDSAAASAVVLWKRAPCLGRKNWRARKAGRAARKRLLDGDIVLWCVFRRGWVSAVGVVRCKLVGVAVVGWRMW
jgi:hypothetical protein